VVPVAEIFFGCRRFFQEKGFFVSRSIVTRSKKVIRANIPIYERVKTPLLV
jgi:hypothetical protein